jgi:hypothetical protein
MNKKNKKHLNFDLDFLESVKTEKPKQEEIKPEPKKPAETTPRHKPSASNPSEDYSTNDGSGCLGRIGGWIIALVVIGIIKAVFSGFSGSDLPSNCDTAKLESLKPAESQKTRMDNLERTIDSTYVNNYSDISVNSYNSLVDEYNMVRNNYNSQVDAYNQYLNSNCKE